MARILVVDKNYRPSDDLISSLRKSGNPVGRVKTLERALEMLKYQWSYDVIIIRHTSTEDQDSLGAIERLRQHGHERGTIIVRVPTPESGTTFLNLPNCHTAHHNNMIIEIINLLEH